MDIQKKKKDKLIQNYIPQSKNLIATSDSVFDCYNKLGVSSSRVHRITNGVVLDNFKIKVDKNTEKKKWIRSSSFNNDFGWKKSCKKEL